ncbi:MAG: short-chain oxidoreductase, partial [Gammaproteobacteria bacterium]|nr:short-chain oxidoreductase [Gammaproteobacteria bacterium]
AIIHRFGADGLLTEACLVELSRQKLLLLQQQFHKAGYRLIERLLTTTMLPCKANLLTRVHDVDELTAEKEQAVYISIKNPFFITTQSVEYADRLLSISA